MRLTCSWDDLAVRLPIQSHAYFCSASRRWLRRGYWIPHIHCIPSIIVEVVGRQHAARSGHVRFTVDCVNSMSQDSCIESELCVFEREVLR